MRGAVSTVQYGGTVQPKLVLAGSMFACTGAISYHSVTYASFAYRSVDTTIWPYDNEHIVKGG